MNIKLLGLFGTTATLIFVSSLFNPSQATPTVSSSSQPIILAQGKFSKLNLTPEQQTQMRQIGESTRTQIENVLTEEQKTQLRAAKEQGQNQNRRQVWSSLNLTSEQQTQIQNIRQEAKQKMKAILTPEQQQQLEQMQQNRRQS